MGDYFYRASEKVHHLVISQYEAHLLSRVHYHTNAERGVMAVHKADLLRTVDRTELLQKGTRLLGFLEQDGDLLQFRYGIEMKVPEHERFRSTGVGGRACRFRGDSVIAEAGPGFCHIVVADIRTDGLSTVVDHRRVHDLRDMQTVELDDGVALRGARRRRRVEITAKIRELVAFLRNVEVAGIEHWYVHSRGEAQ